MDDIDISKAAYDICMRQILLWLGYMLWCCTMGGEKQLKHTKKNAKNIQKLSECVLSLH